MDGRHYLGALMGRTEILTMMPQALRYVNSMVLTVPTLAEARPWYRQALGAKKVWGAGRVVELTVEGNHFRIGQPRKHQRGTGAGDDPTATVLVYSPDPDFLVEYAILLGAEGGADPVREHDAPWGTQWRGGFVDPFGHSWVVSDISPLRWHGPGRTHHLDYVQAVVDELAAQGIETRHLRDTSTDLPAAGITVAGGEAPKRAATMVLDDALVWTHLKWAEMAALSWDEEYGWTVTIRHLLGDRGYVHERCEIGGGLVPNPATVAWRVQDQLANGGTYPDPRQTASDPTSELESSLALYLPT